jgi:hypothetical protein
MVRSPFIMRSEDGEQLAVEFQVKLPNVKLAMLVCEPLKTTVLLLSSDVVPETGNALFVPSSLNAAPLCKVKASVTVKIKVEASRVPVPATVQLLTVGDTSSVTVCPAAMVTSSLDPGTIPPVHVVVVFQVQVCALVIAVAPAVALNNARTRNDVKIVRSFFIMVPFRNKISAVN